MKKTIYLSALAFITIGLWSCTPKAAKSSNSTAKVAAPTPQEIQSTYSATQLATGETIFNGNCAKCHKLNNKQPISRTGDQWEKILARMIPKAKLSTEDGKLVRAYVLANAKTAN
jgi:mono/diheme cytochrome c family protein